MKRVIRRHRRQWGYKRPRYRSDGKLVGFLFSFLTPMGTQAKYPNVHIPDRISKQFSPMTELEGEAWLSQNYREIVNGTWVPPQVKKLKKAAKVLTFGQYAKQWLENRQLRESTKQLYEKLFRDHLLPAFGDRPIQEITSLEVEQWYNRFPIIQTRSGATYGQTVRWNAYSTLRAILNSATKTQPDGKPRIIARNPCDIPVSKPSSKHRAVIASYQELLQLYNAMPEELALSIYLAGILTLRRGEILGLERRDIDVGNRIIHVRRQAKPQRGDDGKTHMVLTETKTQGSARDIVIPDRLMPLIRRQLDRFCGRRRDSFLFPGKTHDTPYSASGFGTRFRKARSTVPRLEEEEMHFHDLRHTAETEWMENGGSLKGGMGLSGHTTAGMELHYEHASLSEQKIILSEEIRDVPLPDGNNSSRT